MLFHCCTYFILECCITDY